MTTYNIDRTTASKLLNVSLRTVDRYLKQEKLTSIKSDGRVWLSKDEILNSLNKTGTRSRGHRQSTDSLVVDPVIISDNQGRMSTQGRRFDGHKESFQYNRPRQEQPPVALVTELRQEIAIKDKRLAQASYKIGQLESTITTMIPQIELQKSQKLLVEKAETYEKQIKQKEAEIEQTHSHYIGELKQKTAAITQIAEIHKKTVKTKNTAISRLDRDLHLEKINKWIYAVILYVLVIGIVVLLVVTRGL